MNENTNPFPADLLSGLAANPELLKNAMQMASALASSGMLNGLLGGSPGGESPSAAASFGQPPPSNTPPNGSGQASGGIADLLAGLMGQSANSSNASSFGKDSFSPSTAPPKGEQDTPRQEPERKHSSAPSHNDRIHLLQSICPFLSEEKREKVQFLIKLLGLLSAAEQMGIGSGKLF